jgi:hypothetical protein
MFFKNRICKHKYDSFIKDVDGIKFQFCTKCGIAKHIELKHKHDWILIHESDVYNPGDTKEDSYPIYRTRTYECSDPCCREVKKHKA